MILTKLLFNSICNLIIPLNYYYSIYFKFLFNDNYTVLFIDETDDSIIYNTQKYFYKDDIINEIEYTYKFIEDINTNKSLMIKSIPNHNIIITKTNGNISVDIKIITIDRIVSFNIILTKRKFKKILKLIKRRFKMVSYLQRKLN